MLNAYNGDMRPSVDYTHIFEGSLNEIYVFSAKTLHFIEVNRGARENLGYSMDELRRLTPLDLKHEFTLETFKILIAPLRDGSREKIVFETTHHRKNGSYYPVEVHLHRSKVGHEHVFVAIILDITERKMAQEHALNLAMEQERVRLIREFIGDVSHDLKTPLTQLGTSLFLLERLLTDEQQHHHLRRSEQALFRVNRMIDSMLQMNELELQDSYDMTPIDLNRFVASIVEASDAISRQQELSLQFEPKTLSRACIVADVQYLTRALDNILMNALTYSTAGGNIIVTTDVVSDYAQIKVSDTGVGIEAKHIPHIFKRFYRADDARNTFGGSNGLGLAIAKKVIEAHKGTITVQSTAGEGTTICIDLPLAPCDDTVLKES